nr:hypothetical protein Q903MT_gene2259 [Picea sitchensis]
MKLWTRPGKLQASQVQASSEKRIPGFHYPHVTPNFQYAPPINTSFLLRASYFCPPSKSEEGLYFFPVAIRLSLKI